jgi:hypothetical protein
MSCTLAPPDAIPLAMHSASGAIDTAVAAGPLARMP